MIDLLLLDILVVVQHDSAILQRSIVAQSDLPNSIVSIQANAFPVHHTIIQGGNVAGGDDNWQTENVSGFPGCFCHDCSMSREIRSPAGPVLDTTRGRKVETESTAEEAPDDRHLVTDSSYSIAERISWVQTDHSEAVGLGETEWATSNKAPPGDLLQANVESTIASETLPVVSRISLPNATITQSQLTPTTRGLPRVEKDKPQSTEPTLEVIPESPRSRSSFNPSTAFNSRITGEETTSVTANKGRMDSPPASLHGPPQSNADIQSLMLRPSTDLSTRSLQPPSSRHESRSSHGFTSFASRAEIHRAFPHFRGLWSRTPTPEIDHRQQDSDIDDIPVEADEDASTRQQQGAGPLTVWKPRSRKFLFLPKFLRRKPRCACSDGYWNQCKVHKQASDADSTQPESCVCPEESSLGQGLCSSLTMPPFDFESEARLRQRGHVGLLDGTEHGIGVARSLGPEQGVLATRNTTEDRTSHISDLDLSNGSWQHLSQQQLSLTFPRGEEAQPQSEDEPSDQIGVAWPLGPENGVFTSQRRAEGGLPKSTEPAFGNGSWHYVPHLRGGGRRDRNRFYDARGDDAPISPWLWWFAGGRPLTRDSAPITRGVLRDWRRRSDSLYTLSDGRWASGRARRMGTDIGRMERETRSRVRSSSPPPGGPATRPKPPGSGGVQELGPGNVAAPAVAEAGGDAGQRVGGSPVDADAQVHGGLPH